MNMSDIQNPLLLRKGVIRTEYERALNFVAGCALGIYKFGQFIGETAMHGPDECFVYFAKCGDAVKIGMTKGDPRRRVKAMQTGCPEQIELVGYVLATPALESDLHIVLSDERIRGEWFKWTPFVERVIVGELQEEVI